MKAKSQLTKLAKTIAEDNFDKQMLDLLEVILSMKVFHPQHRHILIEYIETDKRLKGK